MHEKNRDVFKIVDGEFKQKSLRTFLGKEPKKTKGVIEKKLVERKVNFNDREYLRVQNDPSILDKVNEKEATLFKRIIDRDYIEFAGIGDSGNFAIALKRFLGGGDIMIVDHTDGFAHVFLRYKGYLIDPQMIVKDNKYNRKEISGYWVLFSPTLNNGLFQESKGYTKDDFPVRSRLSSTIYRDRVIAIKDILADIPYLEYNEFMNDQIIDKMYNTFKDLNEKAPNNPTKEQLKKLTSVKWIGNSTAKTLLNEFGIYLPRQS